MNKLPVFVTVLLLWLPCYAADAPPVPVPGPEVSPKVLVPAPPHDEKSQHERLKSLQGTCNERADTQKLAGEARKAAIAKCLAGK